MGETSRLYRAVRLLGLGAAVFCVFALSACSSYVNQSAVIKQALLAEDYPEALGGVEKIDRDTSGLLYHLERGLILHYQGEYAASNEAFEQADILLEDLYTKSVTRELAALAVTDIITKFRGDPFEAVLVNYYKILNYLQMNDMEGALVECRRVNNKLQMLIDAGETYFVNDPFVQYLTAMVYRAAYDLTDAEVSFRVAVDAYRELKDTYLVDAPEMLFCDAAETAAVLGDAEAAEEYASHVDCGEPSPMGLGTLNLFLECGYVPHKKEENLFLPIYKDDDPDDHQALAVTLAGRRHSARRSGVKVDYLLRVAMPVLESTPAPFDYAVVRPVAQSPSLDRPQGMSAQTVLVENLDPLAHMAFQEKEGRILIRAIVRNLAKYAAKKGADKKDEGLGLLVNIFNVATETADTRSWSTLPEKILMTRLVLPEGVYDLKVDLFDAAGGERGTFTIPGVEFHKGRTSFLNHRVF